jgi:hypothetical protein
MAKLTKLTFGKCKCGKPATRAISKLCPKCADRQFFRMQKRSNKKFFDKF